MEEFIHQQNLAHYRKMLSEKTHEPQRQTIVRLLATKKNKDDPEQARLMNPLLTQSGYADRTNEYLC